MEFFSWLPLTSCRWPGHTFWNFEPTTAPWFRYGERLPTESHRLRAGLGSFMRPMGAFGFARAFCLR